MKLSSETLKNLPYFWEEENPNPFFHFSFFILSNFGFLTVDALAYVDIDQGIYIILL